MSIRQAVRKTIQRGSSAIGTVVSYNNGKATMRLGGSLLTNLPAMGRVAPGDTAVIDYSAGVIPVVRPTTIQAQAVLPPPLQTTREKRRQEQEGGLTLMEIARLDYGAYISVSHTIQFEFYGQYAYDGVETPIWWRSNETDEDGYRYYCAAYDSGGAYGTYTLWGTPYITAPISGKYLISLDINLGVFWAWAWGVDTTYPGYFRIKLHAGGSLLAEEIAWANHSVNLSAIASLEAGGQIYATIFAKNAWGWGIGSNDAFTLFAWTGWGHFESANNAICVQLLPGTVS